MNGLVKAKGSLVKTKGSNRQKAERRKKERKMKRRNKNSPRLWRVKKESMYFLNALYVYLSSFRLFLIKNGVCKKLVLIHCVFSFEMHEFSGRMLI